MSMHIDDVTSVNFNCEWQCFYQSNRDRTTSNEIVTSSCRINAGPCWSSIELPHHFDDSQREQYDVTATYKWWYRKQFQWTTSIVSNSEQNVYLKFEISDDHARSVQASTTEATVWLNRIQIFQGSLFSVQESIELSSAYLQRNDRTTDRTIHMNVLVICCQNTSLCLNAYLFMYGQIVCARGEVKVVGKHSNVDRTNHDILNYTVSMDDAERRFSVSFNPTRKSKVKFISSSTLTSSLLSQLSNTSIISDQENTSEHQNGYLLVPRLVIVMLIVGTRNDIQPFVAYVNVRKFLIR
jgi:hypothetical protein